tara:strand:- start:349 stop:1629 length:1281 start_codon:yes stop_codon:yes gene_type:complete
MDFLHIAGINRSGGSLLARLFDGHKDILSYPMEVGFHFDYTSYGFLDKITGNPTCIPKFDKNINPIEYFQAEKETFDYKWGSESASKFGVRKNYLEKAYYEKTLQTSFDHEQYVKKLKEYCSKSNSNQEFFEAKHKAYFECWNNNTYFNNPKYVVTHASSGLFLSNFDRYFEDFKNSFIIIPIRDCIGYVASEKIRIARRFFGSRRFSKPLPPNFLVKHFNTYDLNSILRTWLIAISRIKLLQEKYASNNRLIVYRFEKLTESPSDVMKFFSKRLNFDYRETLTTPTLCGKDWLGNSHQGKNKGIKSRPNEYYKNVLRKDEIDYIYSKTSNLNNILQNSKSFELDFLNIDDKYFFDIEKQRVASMKKNTWSLYCALGYSGFRKLKLSNSNYITVIAYFFSIFVRICHIPRLLKQKFFPGLGKQNYT